MATGRIVLGLRPDASTVDALPELLLENDDRFYVTNRSSSISVYGEVVTPSTFIYQPQKRIREYIRQAGGTNRFADQARMFVLRADGSTIGKHASSELWTGQRR